MHYVNLKESTGEIVKKTISLCTLFDKNYLDKGIVLYSSIKKNEDLFELYILTMDDQSYDILKKINDTRIVLIKYIDLEERYPVLEALKKERSAGEICWTCTSLLLEYILDVFCIPDCTYIDSDLAFYSSPRILLEEFAQSKKDVGLTPHRFPNTFHGREALKKSGKYCVEFNTFKNNVGGRRLLELWKNRCLKECSIVTGGDQLYLNDWSERFDNVYDYKNIGAGVAPWNLKNYKFDVNNNVIFVNEGSDRKEMVFYHFQGIQYSGEGRVNINVFAHPDAGFVSHRIVDYFYKPYLMRIDFVRKILKDRYGMDMYIDGCGRNYTQVQFDLKRFILGFKRKIELESVFAAVELIIRVFRKREDIIEVAKGYR